MDEIDKRIADIKYLDEIKELKCGKPKVSKVNSVKAEMEGKKPGANIEGLRENIQKQPSDIKEAKEQKRLISAEYAKLNEERQKQMAEMPKLFEEGQKHQGVIQEKINNRNKIRDEFRKEEKAYNAYVKEVRKVSAEKVGQSSTLT